jgi:membrane-bound lytic murein transglycosylase D
LKRQPLKDPSLRALAALLASALTACTGAQPRMHHVPSMTAPPITVDARRPPTLAPAAAVAPQADDAWDQLRSSFAMSDCDADPSVQAWARRYTRNPRQFESQLRAVLPRLSYVQQVASRYDVPGEFVLLPWVESRFQPVAGRRRRPAGMWQIVPVTAVTMGLRVNAHYDARMDVPAAADAVMRLLKQYHDTFNDWRLVDYAFNAGEFSIRRLIAQYGAPANRPAIPTLPVRRVTREHLVKLLAMACVVRAPERFAITLPTLPQDQQLVKVEVMHSMPMAKAADHAGMGVNALMSLNAGFRDSVIDARDTPSYLLLPAEHARRFRDALLDEPASATAANDFIRSVPHAAASPPADAAEADRPPVKTHTVRRGESLRQIARRYSVNIRQLQRWNHLQADRVKPGLVLQVSDPT